MEVYTKDTVLQNTIYIYIKYKYTHTIFYKSYMKNIQQTKYKIMIFERLILNKQKITSYLMHKTYVYK